MRRDIEALQNRVEGLKQRLEKESIQAAYQISQKYPEESKENITNNSDEPMDIDYQENISSFHQN